jgi:hypothetical protein
MKSYEYFQETVESISEDNWAMTLKKHGNQGWVLCTINREKTYKKRLADGIDKKPEDSNVKMQTIYTIIFRREL